MILQLLLTSGNRAQAGFLSKKLHFEGTPIHNIKSFARLSWKGKVIGVQERTETWSTFATMENQQLDVSEDIPLTYYYLLFPNEFYMLNLKTRLKKKNNNNNNLPSSCLNKHEMNW